MLGGAEDGVRRQRARLVNAKNTSGVRDGGGPRRHLGEPGGALEIITEDWGGFSW